MNLICDIDVDMICYMGLVLSRSVLYESDLYGSVGSVYMNLICDIDLDMICYISRSVSYGSDLCGSVGFVLCGSE